MPHLNPEPRSPPLIRWQARGQIVAEAEAALLELSGRLEKVISLPGASAAASKPPGSAGRGAGTAAAASGAAGGLEVDGSTLVLAADAFADLCRFGRQMLARLNA